MIDDVEYFVWADYIEERGCPPEIVALLREGPAIAKLREASIECHEYLPSINWLHAFLADAYNVHAIATNNEVYFEADPDSLDEARRRLWHLSEAIDEHRDLTIQE